jgi:hypothetical protein
MMCTRRHEILETATGVGTVQKDGTKIANVRYRLLVRQEYHDEVPTLQNISAEISVISGERDWGEDSILTLHLADGRQWKFLVVEGNLIMGRYSAVSAS